MIETFPELLSPLEAGRLQLKNRVVFPGHQTLLSYGGVVGDRMLGYYRERARGGAGMVVVEGAAVHPTTIKFPEYLIAYDEAIIPSLDRLADALHEYDCKTIVQIAHSGSRMGSLDSRLPVWSPSDVRSPMSPEVPHAMTLAEIEEVRDGFAISAANVARSGCDGVEIHAAHGYLLSEFLSPVTNRRSDGYGGSLANRMRFLLEVAERVRDAVGDEKVVGLRMNGSDLLAGGLENEDCVEIARIVAATGLLDYISVSAGLSTHNHVIVSPMDAPRGGFVDYAAAIRAAVDVPVIAVGRIKTPQHAEQILAAGQADAVAMARALMADPSFVTKAATAPETIRPCIGCNQGCFGNLYTARPLTCTVNPAVGHELTLGLGTQTDAGQPRRIAVVGGGPAGLEAALTAAERGHDVVVFEAEQSLGGQLVPASAVASRAELLEILEHQVAELERLGVEVRCGTRASVGDLLEGDFDAVVVATGSRERGTPFGGEGVRTLTPLEVLGDDVDRFADRRVVVYDDVGHFPAYVPAEVLADAGARVVVVTPRMVSGSGLDVATTVTMHRRLAGKGVRFVTRTAGVAVEPEGLRVRDTFSDEQWLEPADVVVAAIGNTAADGLLDELRSAGVEVHGIGDCVAPRTLTEAIREGRLTGRSL